MRRTNLETQRATQVESASTATLPNLEVLINEHASALCSIASVILVDREEAESVTAAFLIDVADRSYEAHDQNVRRHLSRLLYEVCVRSRRDSRPQREGMIGQRRTSDEDDDLMVLLSTLSEQERAAIALCSHGAHSYRDIAILLALPVPVVLSLLRSGLRGLQPGQWRQPRWHC